MARLRSLGAALLALVGAAAAGVPPTARFGAEVALLADEGWIMGPTSIPDPTVDGYMGQVEELYLAPSVPWFPGQPTFPGYPFDGLTTPEQFCPLVCLPPPHPNLTFAESVNRGVEILHGALVPQLEAGDHVTVFGYSQSATIATQEMNDLAANPPGGGYDPDNLHLVLIGDPNNPIGGILTRFPAQPLLTDDPVHLPFLGIPLSIGPTPTGSFVTDIYTGEYDGFANFPQDPTNVVAMINAIIGIPTVHFDYLFFDNPADLGATVDLGTIGDTDFYLIPQQLPILWPLYQLGDVGKAAGDALAPGLKLVIDWGYGNPGDPGAGFGVDGADPIGAAGPWAVTASGQLADGSGVAGFVSRMDPLQMLAGAQYAAVHSFVDPVNDLLGFAGQQPLPDSFVDSLLAGYHFTNAVDAFVLNGWKELAGSLNVVELLGPDAVFDGEPLISLGPLLDLGAVVLELLNVLGA